MPHSRKAGVCPGWWKPRLTVLLCSSNRPPNRSNGSTAVTATQESGEVPPPAVAAGASARASRSDNGGERSSAGVGEPDSPSWCRTKPISPFDGLGVFQTRSIFHIPRRTSSGYFSFDGESQPNSPLSPRQLTADKATQTPSPSCQVIQHALQRKPNEYGGGPGTHQQHGEHRQFAWLTADYSLRSRLTDAGVII